MRFSYLLINPLRSPLKFSISTERGLCIGQTTPLVYQVIFLLMTGLCRRINIRSVAVQENNPGLLMF